VAEFFVDFRIGISKVDEELLDLGVKIELFERPNNRSYVIAGEKLSSRDQAIEYIAQNRQMVEDMIRGHYMSGGDSVRESEIAETEVSKDPFSDEEEDVA
jgi:hypothetical protein